MTAGRALGLLVVLAAAGSWVASGFLARRPAPVPADEPLPVSQTEVSRATARLVLGVRGLTSPKAHAAYTPPARNPFQFGTSPTPPAQPGPSARPSSAMTASSTAPNTPPERPPMQLSGVAEDPGPSGPVRRAVITAAGELFVVATGDLVLGRFRVARIDAEAVELEDLQGGPKTILTLR